MTETLIADSYVTLTALAGLFILRSSLKPSNIIAAQNRRFIFAINIIILMLIFRVLVWTTQIKFFDTILLIAASLIPLAMLVLCEGLMRRHAHMVLKLFTTAGIIVFTSLAFFTNKSNDTNTILALLIFQVTMLSAIGLWVITRDRQKLSTAENQNINSLAWSLLLILPLAITDFRTEWINSPVRSGGIAILFLCWLALSADRMRTNPLSIMISFAIIFLGVCLATFSINLITGISAAQSLQVAAIMLSTGLLLQVFAQARSLKRKETHKSLIPYIVNFDKDDHEQFIKGLQNQQLFSDALILDENDLSDFDHHFFEFFREKKFVISGYISEQSNNKYDEQLSWLFEKYKATHAILISEQPLKILVLDLPSFAEAPETEKELKIAQRVALLMSSKETV